MSRMNLFSAAVTALAFATASAALAQEPAATVEMTNSLQYEPAQITVSVGDTVRWQNTSGVVHTVTADPAKAANSGNAQLPQGAEPFDSGNIPPGQSFTYTFDVPGQYRYFCIPHETAGMVGSVTVQPR